MRHHYRSDRLRRVVIALIVVSSLVAVFAGVQLVRGDDAAVRRAVVGHERDLGLAGRRSRSVLQGLPTRATTSPTSDPSLTCRARTRCWRRPATVRKSSRSGPAPPRDADVEVRRPDLRGVRLPGRQAWWAERHRQHAAPSRDPARPLPVARLGGAGHDQRDIRDVSRSPSTARSSPRTRRAVPATSRRAWADPAPRLSPGRRPRPWPTRGARTTRSRTPARTPGRSRSSRRRPA